jgi:hypothetical protein
MPFLDRAEDISTTTGTGPLTLAETPPSDKQGLRGYGMGVGIDYSILLGNQWEVGHGVLVDGPLRLMRAPTSSSMGGALVDFVAGTKKVYGTVSADTLSKMQLALDVAFSFAVPLSVRGDTRMQPAQSVTSAITFTAGPNPVAMARAYARLIADGVAGHVPAFLGFKEMVGSAGYDNRAGIVNMVQFLYDGWDYWYTIWQAVGATAADVTPPTEVSAIVSDGAASSVDIMFSEAMDTNYVPAAGSLTASGHTVTALVFVSSILARATVTGAYVNGAAASVLAYTKPTSNYFRDLSGNALETFSGKAITNNVGVAATKPVAPTIGVAVAGDGYIDVYFTRNGNGGSAVIDSKATLSTGQNATGTTSPIRVVAPNGTAATATVQDRNAINYSDPSAASNSVTPAAAVVTSVRMQGTKSNDVVESNSAPWDYASPLGATGASGIVSTLILPAATDGEVVFEVETLSGDFMVGVAYSNTIAAYSDLAKRASIWSNGGTAYKTFGNKTTTSAVVPAVKDRIRYKKFNSGNEDYLIDYEIAVSKNGGAWTVIETNNAGTNGLRKLPLYIYLQPGANAVLRVVSTVGFA